MRRSYEKEIIDLGPSHYTRDEYEDCLVKLDRVGRWLGGHAANFEALKRFQPSSILDVGCGGGLFTIAMAKRYPQAKVVGIEVNPLAIAFAKKQVAPANVSFELRQDLPEKSYDVVIATLVCHHMDDESLVAFLKKAKKIATKGVILNDLHRHPLALLGFQVISPLFFRNRLVQHDGPLSVRRSLTRKEWKGLLAVAGIENYAIHWRWAFRWMVEIWT
ncbi:MAG: methyltransferase domain-containing protein [Parachlamydia sp.]|nr:methyltransferase domain-containing protein [Parachlamydia sp.]